MPVKIVDKDHGFTRIVLNFRELNGHSIKVGFWGDEEFEGTSVVDYATYNEFGTSRIPARPFMGTTYDQNKDRVVKFVEYNVGQIIDGKSTPDHALRVIGEFYQKAIQLTIRNAKEWAVPDADSTIKAKGSTSPLIDTGRMVNSVKYEVN